jgi:sulfate transport system substrate-binding protein
MRILTLILAVVALAAAEPAKLLNVSYDVIREFYKDINTAFAATPAGSGAAIDQSHGGSTKQARAVIDGLEADVVTMNQASDIDRIAAAKLLSKDWRTRFPNGAVPNTSTIIFVVRKGNPKQIAGWDDLVKEGVRVIIPNPKTSGNGRYSYLAAWAHGLRAGGGDEAKAKDFVKRLFANVPILDTGGRAATTTFAQRGIGDVLLTFESEVALITKDAGGDDLEAVVPAVSIKADNPVAVVDNVAAKHGTTALAKAYLDFLFSPEGQAIAVKHGLRPVSADLLAKDQAKYAKPELITVEDAVGGWDKAFAVHFNDGGIFDQIAPR